eukprot:scaffold3766_cov124-Isochrysis_galbana.AAC.6
MLAPDGISTRFRSLEECRFGISRCRHRTAPSKDRTAKARRHPQGMAGEKNGAAACCPVSGGAGGGRCTLTLCCWGRKVETIDQTGEKSVGTLMMRIFCTIGGKSPPHASST